MRISMAHAVDAGSPEDLPLWWLTRFLLTRFGAICAYPIARDALM